MNISLKHTLATGLFLLLPVHNNANAQINGSGPPPASARMPSGIYVVVRVEDVLQAEFELLKQEHKAGLTIAGSNLYLSNLYAELLKNPAVSGLAVQIHWDTLNPNPPGETNDYFWDFLDDAFTSVDSWNSGHPDATVPKTIQLTVSAGFNSPPWLLPLLAPACDGLFYGPPRPPGSTCGYATFTNFGEKGDSVELPMPWNTTYQATWKTFLQALAARYNDNPDLVSIAVAGPTAASAEMILPNNNKPNKPNTPTQKQFESSSPTCQGCGGSPISPNQMWAELLSNAGIPETSQAFSDPWEQAIDTYGGIFSGLTLVVNTGNGLPDVVSGDMPGEFPDPTVPFDFAADCKASPDMDCQAETTILSYFAQAYPVGGANAKATQTSGLEAAHEGPGDLGIDGVRFLSQQTATPPAGTSQILGGAQVNSPVSRHPAQQASTFANIDQALYNALQDFFNYTAVAPGYYCENEVQPGLSGPAPLNYLQIYYQDVQYADMHSNEGKVSVDTAGTTGSTTCGNLNLSFQEELNTASANISNISEN
jgi:hypothetical protein